MNYKDTLLMPKTDFEMRGNLTKKEPKFIDRWEEMNLFELVEQATKENKPFAFHDGPPYANGNMHIGHMLNKVIKDIIVRYKQMTGHYVHFIPGWDTHGLPIETAIQKLGVNRKEMSVADFREKCKEYALQQVEKQKEQLVRMGTMADYHHPYVTLDPAFEANQINVFASMALDGLIYKGKKPVYWSYSSESALAEAEIEYYDVKSPTIFVTFDVKDGKGILEGDEKFVIWTTTPWTIPANTGICLNPDLVYAVVKTSKGKLIMLESKVEELLEKFKLNDDYSVLKTFKGQELEYVVCTHPFASIDDYYKRDTLVVLGDHVTDDAGTGCVHTAPGHGVDDFNVGMKYNLPILCPVDDKGLMMEEAGEFLKGQHVDKANKIVGQTLDEMGHLLSLEFITHSYPHDWRTKKPVIFRATAQWFCSIDKIRDKLLEEIDKTNWINPWGHIRLYNMIKDRGDWCISRQRAWGVPIPIFYCEDGTPIIDKEVFTRISNLFREYGSNIWFEKDEKFLLPEGYTNEHSPNGIFKKETDIMDVWFDSGSSHTGVMKERLNQYPMDLYFEGSDQYRGWFNSSLIIGTAVYNQAPYKTVLSHGMVLDGKGNKMSKSLGNTVDPVKLVNQYGADVVRLWVASVAYQQDVRISDEIMKQVAESYRKIRNTLRFLHGNLNGFKTKHLVALDQLELVDEYVLSELNKVIVETKKAYENYDFAEANQIMTNYMINTLSAFYGDFTKDILYIEKEDDLRRRQVQTVFYYNLKALTRLFAPILVFTTEELHDYFDFGDDKAASIALEKEPEVLDLPHEQKANALLEKFLEVRKDVLKALENKRNEKVIGKSLEAKLTISLKDEFKDILELNDSLKQMFIVSKCEVTDEHDGFEEFETSYIKVEKFNGHVCARCWCVFDDEDMHNDELCERCYDVINK